LPLACSSFLSKDYNDEATRKDLVKKLEQASGKLKQLVLSVGEPDGPENYKLNKEAEVTVLLYEKHKVAANFAFAKDKLTDKDVAAIVAQVNKMVSRK
jgi:hypothetical protein